MRMPFTEFLTNGDLKFVVVMYAFLIAGIYFLVKKISQKENEAWYNQKLNTLAVWSVLTAVFSLLLGLLHSFYFISKASGIASHLLFGGLSNMLITPTLGIAIAMILKFFTISLKK